MSAMQLNHAAGWLAERLLNGVPAGLVIAIAVWILLRLLGHKNSSTRFAVWFSTLVAVGLLPLLGSFSFGGSEVRRPVAFTAPSFWGTVLLGIWATLAGLALLRLGLSLRSLRNLRLRHQPVQPAALPAVLPQTLREFQLSRKVALAISDELRVPTAIGFFKPMIIVPKWALSELSPEELKAILIHELAHLKRWDDCTNLVQKVLRAIFFFNPAICWIENLLSLEREIACDDAVLARTANPRAYAECLVTVAEKSFVRRGVALAQAAVSRMRQTSCRIAQILDADRPGATRVWRPALALVTAFSAACLVTFSHAPELIAFSPPAEHSAPMLASNLEKPQPALLIPARFEPNSATVTRTPHRSARSRAGHAPVLQAKLRQPAPIPVHAIASVENYLSTQTVLLVIETRDGTMMPSWTVCMWRITFVNSGQVRSASEIPAKQI